MKILYGIQGTGNGHISRSRIMAQYLAASHADVTYLFSGRDKDKFFDMEIFADYLHCRGLTFASRNGRIDPLKTLLKNNILMLLRDIQQLKLDDYDLIISDFEPVTAWAAKLKCKPSIGIGHQYAFTSAIPLASGHHLAKMVMNNFAPVKFNIGLHWYPFADGILPPIIDIQLQRNGCEQYYLVYLPFENQAQVTKMLNAIEGYQFLQYSPDVIDSQCANVALRQSCLGGFKRDLSKATGVICNAGFELISECLHLQIPILARPLAGQIEQLSNALVLSQLGYADTLLELNEQAIKQWLEKDKSIPTYSIPNVAEPLVKWVLAGQWENSQSLMNGLWKRIKT